MQDGTVKLLQGVREVFEFVDTEQKDEGGVGKIVLIGKVVDKVILQKSLEDSILT